MPQHPHAHSQVVISVKGSLLPIRLKQGALPLFKATFCETAKLTSTALNPTEHLYDQMHAEFPTGQADDTGCPIADL